MGAYRGAGRPEAAAYLERIMEMASYELGIDPLELRRRNFLQPSDFPFVTLTGASYDTGDYERSLDEAARVADYAALRVDQAVRRTRGDRLQLGIGVAAYVEVTGAGGSSEYGYVEIHADGTATVRAGTSSHGQGHATSFAMIVSYKLGIPLADIRFEQSDTALIPRGNGTAGSRSLQIGGSAVAKGIKTSVVKNSSFSGGPKPLLGFSSAGNVSVSGWLTTVEKRPPTLYKCLKRPLKVKTINKINKHSIK
jgi:carbon-monoxide dehydrogenase large subunit